MKKHLTLIAGVMLVGGAVAQSQFSLPVSAAKKNVQLFTGDKMPVSGTDNATKAPGDVLWSNNFSSSNHWVSTAVNGTVAADFGWQIGTAPNQITTWAFNNTGTFTGGGGYAGCENGDPTASTQDNDAEWILTYDSIFDFSAIGSLIFEFEEYGARFTDLQAVEVSVDGGTVWTEIGNNNDLPMLTASGGSPYANPTLRSYNVTAALFGAGLSLSNNMKFRFHVSWPNGGTNGGVMYGWFVDNVKLIEGYADDVNLKTVFAFTGTQELSYTKFPVGQVATDATTSFMGIVSNLGSNSQDMDLTVTNAAPFSAVNTPSKTINAFATDTIDVAGPYTIPSTVGATPFTYTAESSNNTLQNTSNDVKTTNFEVTNKIYGIDTYTNQASITGGFFGWATPNGDPAIGSFYEIFNNQSVGAIEIGIAGVNDSDTATYIGRIVYAQIHSYDLATGNVTYIDQTVDHEVAGTDFGNLVRLYFQNPVQLNAGQVYVVTAAMYDGSEVPIAFSGYVMQGQTVGFNGTNLTTLAADDDLSVEAPVVRLDFTDYTGLNEISAATGVSVYPNPFTNETAINFTLKADSQVSLVVTDIAGRVVMTTPATSMAAGEQTIAVDGSSFQAGVYNYTLQVGNEVITKRIIKK